MRIRRCLSAAGRILAFVAATTAVAHAGGVGISTPPDTSASPEYAADTTLLFNPYHVPSSRSPKAHRDLQFLWSPTYADRGVPLVPPDPSQVNDLDRLGMTICDSYSNTFGFLKSDIELVCQMLDFRSNGYDRDANSPGFTVNRDDPAYDLANKQKADTYIYAPYVSSTDRGDLHSGTMNRGQFPSAFTSANEDVDTGRAFGQINVLPWNSLMVPGPRMNQVGDTGPTRWTRPDTLQNWGFDHEFQHCLNQGNPWGPLTEIFSSSAEAICGELDAPAAPDAPYTWGLMHDGNYQGWRTFTAYLAYHYRGADVTAANLRDDLIARWAQRTTNHTLSDLAAQLADSACVECRTLPYFEGLDAGQRLGVVLHNCHIATYVNHPTFDRGQYGFAFLRPDGRPAFDPVRDVGWWHDNDPGANNNVALPMEATASAAWRTKLTSFTQYQVSAQAPVSRQLGPEMFGAEFAVVHGASSLGAGPEDLVVRVGSDTLINWVKVRGICGEQRFDGRLYASVISYSHDDTALYAHPEWMTGIQTQSMVVDSVRADMEFVVPGFGGTGAATRAVVVVVSLSDGPSGTYGAGGTESAVLPIRYTFGLRVPPALASNPIVVRANDCDSLMATTWSPAGDELAYAVVPAAGGYRQVFRQHVGGVPTLLFPQSADQYDPDWSPRGDRILFTQHVSQTRRDLWIYTLSSGACAPLIAVSDRIVRRPVFSPNGRAIAYVSDWSQPGAPSDTTSPLPIHSHELRRFGLDDGSDVLLVQASYAQIGTVRWSPDGSSIYFARGDSLLAVDATGLVRDVTGMVGGGSVASYDFSRGRERVVAPGGATAFASRYCETIFCACQYGHTDLIPIGRRFISLVDIGGQKRSVFYQFGSAAYGPRWSHDGTRVAYVRIPNGSTTGDLVIGQPEFNHAPVFAGLGDTSFVHQGGTFAITLSASDPDGDPVAYKAAYLPQGATLDSLSGQLVWTGNQPVGDYFVALRALDPWGGVASRVVKFTVSSDWGGCPFADTWAAAGWQVENSILGRSVSGTLGLDSYRLKAAPALENGRYRVRLRESEQEETTLDQVRLAVVDHAPDQRAWALGERVVLGTRVPPYRVTTHQGKDITSLVNGSGTGYFVGSPGDTVLIELVKPGSAVAPGEADPGNDGLDPFEDDDGGKDGASGGGGYRAIVAGGDPATTDALVLNSTGILIQGQNGDGTWSTIRRRYPRENNDQFMVDTLDQGPVRMVFVGRHRLNYVGRVVPTGAVTPQPLELLAARHSRLGEVGKALLGAGDATTALLPGDTLGLEFEATPVAEGMVRDFFLLARGVYTTAAASLASRIAPTSSLPTAYALLQNRPNPFTGGTVIEFALPRAERVKLEVFDLAGRRVRVLAEGSYTAGRWNAEWDRRDGGGSVVRPGVYLYRVRAGAFQSQRKMVLMP